MLALIAAAAIFAAPASADTSDKEIAFSNEGTREGQMFRLAAAFVLGFFATFGAHAADSDSELIQYAEGSIQPWDGKCEPPVMNYPNWIGFPVTKCAYSDIGATVHTYMLNADRAKLARWVITSCHDAKTSNMHGCIKWLVGQMISSASYNIFPVAGYIPEPEDCDYTCCLFRDGVTVKTALRPHFAKPINGSCGPDDAESTLPLTWAGQFARIASTTRADYKTVHPEASVDGVKWVDIVRSEYQKAWNSDRNELLAAKAIHAHQLRAF
jgi:hypothetical protein